MLANFVIYITFIPWLFYFTSLCKNAIKDFKDNDITWNWVKKNLFKIFRFDNVILIAIFVYFATWYKDSSQIWLVEVLLFSAVNLYLFFNRYYDKNRSESNIGTGDVSTILIILILVIIPLIYYVSTDNYVNTYYILFGYSFFNYVIVFIAKAINDFILKIVRRKSHEK